VYPRFDHGPRRRLLARDPEALAGRVKAAVRFGRPEIMWPALGLLWIIAITVSQGSSAKSIYFGF
jgi:hypothetical protein